MGEDAEPTSKRGRVRATLNKDGPDAAKALAAKLGIGPARVRRWLSLWSGSKGETPTSTDAEPTMTRPAPKPPDPKDRVCLKGRPDLRGTFLERGPKQSRVLWDNGNVVTANNEWVTPIRQEQL